MKKALPNENYFLLGGESQTFERRKCKWIQMVLLLLVRSTQSVVYIYKENVYSGASFANNYKHVAFDCLRSTAKQTQVRGNNQGVRDAR